MLNVFARQIKLQKDNFEGKSNELLLEFVAILKYFKSNLELSKGDLLKIDFISTISVSTLRRVMLSPEGRQWIFLTYSFIKGNNVEFIQDYLKWKRRDGEGSLRFFFDELDRFILGIVVIEKTVDYEFDLDIANLNFIPGADLFYMGADGIHISARKNSEGFLNKILEDFTPLPASTRYLFMVDFHSEAACLNIPGREYLERKNKVEILELLNTIDLAFDIIERSEYEDFSNLTKRLKYFVPIQPPNGSLPSSSNSTVDGMIWFSYTDNHLLLAEMIIHEYSHQKLFQLQDCDPLISHSVHGNGWDEAKYYSPWRDDPRPINGVFHGFVVFTEAALFWYNLIRKKVVKGDELELCKQRFGLLVSQLKLAQESISGEYNFTNNGFHFYSSYANLIKQELFPFAQAVEVFNLPAFHMEYHDMYESSAKATVLEVVKKHKTNWLKINKGYAGKTN